MAESELAVTPGSGLNMRTNSRTIGGNTRHEQFTLLGDSGKATYTAIGVSCALATSGDHLLIVQADGTNYTRIHRITIRGATPGTAGVADIRVLRTSTAGSGGGSVSARAFDAGDTTPYAGVCMTDPTARGTEGDQLLQFRLPVYAATGSSGFVEWRAENGYSKPIIIGTSTANGICVKIQTGIATDTVDVEVEFTVSAHL